jgi:AcrR family transcriptional regulator
MYERGVTATTTEDVRRAAGVSNSQLYHYFADKDDLTRAVIAYQVERILCAQEQLLANVDRLEALEGWRDAVLVAASENRLGCPLGSLASELASQSREARSSLQTAFARWQAALSGAMSRMRETRALRADADPDQLALALLAALQGGLLLITTGNDTTPLRVALDTVIAHIRTYVPSNATEHGDSPSRR